MTGFEPAISSTQNTRDTKLRYIPFIFSLDHPLYLPLLYSPLTTFLDQCVARRCGGIPQEAKQSISVLGISLNAKSFASILLANRIVKTDDAMSCVWLGISMHY